MSVRAKMKCVSVTKFESCEMVVLDAVSQGGKPEDNTYATATPQAKVEMTINNSEALGAFEAGKAYYVDFTPAQPPAEA
jgi:hypothetical protein